MAKKATPNDANKKAKRRERPERTFEAAAAPMVSAPNRSVTSEEVIARLRGLGRGWDDETKELLWIPSTLFANTEGSTEYYSRTLDFGISGVVANMVHGVPPSPSENDYGICLYERANTTYFVLVDMRRRIVVRERLVCYQHQPPEQDWGNIRNAIKAAVELAGRDDIRKEGLVAVFDGTLKTLKPKGSSPEEKPLAPPAPRPPASAR